MSFLPIKKIAIFRALQLGDLLCAIPAIRLLRQTFPDAKITLVGLPWAQQLITRFPHYFDELIAFPGFPGLPEQPLDVQQTIAFLQHMAAQQFDLALQMQGNGSIVNPMVTLFNAKHTGGFYRKEDYYPGDLFIEYPDTPHEIERHLLLVQHICKALQQQTSNLETTISIDESANNNTAFSSDQTHLEFPITQNDKEELAQLQLPVLPKNYVCIHPGSRGAWRQWPTEYFAHLGDTCAAAGLQVVLTGTAAEATLTQAVKQYMKNPVVDATGLTSLGAMGALLKDAFLLIANCTGVSHIAAALNTPSVIISMDGEPNRWAPLNQHLHPTIDWTKTPDFAPVESALRKLLNAF